MSAADVYGLGILLVGLGLVFYGLTRLLMSALPRARRRILNPTTAGPDNPSQAALVLTQGGRLLSINAPARDIFNLEPDERPNLENLTRRVRDSRAFLNLCATAGQARFALNGRFVEGVSFRLQSSSDDLMLVTLQTQPSTPQEEISALAGGQALPLAYTELSQAMSSSLELEPTLKAILESVDHLLPADRIELSLWEAQNQVLVTYHLIEIEGGERGLEREPGRYRIDQGYAGHLFVERAPVLLEEAARPAASSTGAEAPRGDIHSYLGLPLLVGKEFLGLLELGSYTPGAFHASDLELMRVVSGQAAIALHNALLYRAGQRRMAELSGLAQLAQAIGSLRDPKDLFTRLVESISPLVNVEILGFLIYNEGQRTLEGQVPFQGMPDQFIELYRAKIAPGSPAEKILLDQDVLLSEDAAQDTQWQVLEMTHLAEAASLHETALVPLSSGGRMLGYLQASNHRGGPESFSQEELHLLMIIANQAAPIIENAWLVQQSRQRAQRAEALRRIASLASSSATLDEILQYSLQELAHLLRASTAAIFLLDDKLGELRLHPRSLIGAISDAAGQAGRIPANDPQYHFTVTGSLHPLVSSDIRDDPAILPVYHPILDYLDVCSVAVVPLVARDRGVGELWLGSREVDFFDHSDLQVITTAAGQLAGVVEQSLLVVQTDESLRRQVSQLTALARLNRDLHLTLDVNAILQFAYDEAVRITRADCGAVWLLQPEEGSGQPPRVTAHVGDEPAGQFGPLEQKAIEQAAVVCIEDFDREDISPVHTRVRSALIVPAVFKDQVIALIHLHSDEAGRFDPAAAETMQSLAAQAATALGNALQYQEERRRSQALSKSEQALEKLSANTRKLPAGGCPEEALGHIAAAIRDITPFQTITYSLYEPERGVLRQLANAEAPAAEEAPMAGELHWTDVQELLRDERRAGYAYLVPGERSEDELPDGADRGEARDCWLLPLFDDDDQPLGLMRLETPRDVRPDGAASEALELLAAEVRLVMAAARRSEALQQRVEDLEAERARMQAALEESRAVLPALVEKGSEQARAIQRLSQQARRVRDGLEIAELANRQADAHAVLATLAREILARNRLDAALIAEEAPGGPRLVEVIGETPPQAANLEALFGQRNPLRQSFQDGEVQLVAKLPEPIDTQTSPLLAALGARSLICLPVYRGEQVAASILAVGREEMPDFSKEDGQVYHQLARQSAIILQNLNLLTETRQHLHEVNLMLEFGRQLGSLDAASILKTLVESALRLMPQASAGMVAVWDAKTGRLVPQAALGFADTDSVLAIQYAPGEALPGQAFSSGQTLRVDEVDFARDYNLPAEDLLRYRRAAGGLLPLSTLLVPIRAGEMGLGLLELDCFSETGAFNDENEALAGSLAQQTALALENARLFQAAEERAGQLQALNSVAAGLSSSLQSEQMIAGLLGQLKTIVQFDTGTLWLRTGEELTVAAASGFADSEQRLGITAAVDDSQLFKAMTSSGTAVAVADVRADHRFPVLAETERLAWAGIPLVAKNEVVGVIALEKTEADYYNPERLRLASTFASQAAVALENARLYEESLRRTAELDRRAQRLALLNRLSGELSSSLELERILRTAAQELLQALGGSSAAVILFGEDNAPLLVVDEPPSGPGVPPVIADTPVFERMRQTLGILSFYDVQGVGELTPLSVFFQAHDARALLALPLITGAALNGVLFLMSTSPNRFNSSEIELGRTIANQAAIAAQNARLFAETRRLTEDLEQRVRERTAELTAEHHNTQTLLRIITELSASLDIDQVLNRTLGVLNESTGAVSSAILLSKPEELQVDYRAGSCGQDTEGGEQSTVRAELVIAAAVIKKRQALLVEDLAADPVWREAAPSVSAGQSLIGVPLVLGEEILGALVLRRGEALPFTRQQTTLTEAAARQISIALNNASLFNLIRDQAERLGGMLRDQQIEASRSRAILEAVADGVLVTDANNQITLFNASAGKILKLEAGQVLGQSLDRLMGLFGRAGRAWSSTIREWSQNADQERSNETYAERITLEDGRVVAVHLAPVFMRSELLGTVSIFRDVTHEVQVDRLKSEFVANVSHELRTPMTSIKGYVEILLMGAAGELSERQKRFLQIVKNNTERLTILVNDLLDVSRIEAGRVRLSQQALALAEIVQEAADYIGQRSREEDKPMAVVLELPSGLPRVWGDRERVQQIVDNLVGNAYNYTPPGGRILVRLQRRGGEVRVDVVDSGVGIPLEDQPRIFERFFRGDDPLVLATAGTGLGLSITRTLVEMHRGRIWFESRGIPGEGSCFTFTLPVYEGEG